MECEDDEELLDEDRGELCRLARDGDTFRIRLLLSLTEDVLGRLLLGLLELAWDDEMDDEEDEGEIEFSWLLLFSLADSLEAGGLSGLASLIRLSMENPSGFFVVFVVCFGDEDISYLVLIL